MQSRRAPCASEVQTGEIVEGSLISTFAICPRIAQVEVQASGIFDRAWLRTGSKSLTLKIMASAGRIDGQYNVHPQVDTDFVYLPDQEHAAVTKRDERNILQFCIYLKECVYPRCWLGAISVVSNVHLLYTIYIMLVKRNGVNVQSSLSTKNCIDCREALREWLLMSSYIPRELIPALILDLPGK